MRGTRAFLDTALACLCAWAGAVPQMLLVQMRVEAKGDADPNVPILQYLAQDLEEDGRVSPVAWGLSDPMFRAAVEDKILKNPPELPNLQQAKQVASQLKAEYLFVVTAWKEGEKVKAKAQLYRRGSLIWEDPKKSNIPDAMARNQKIAENLAKKQGTQLPKIDDEDKAEPGVRVITISSLAEFSAENAARSLARTYAQLLGSDPLRNLTAKPLQDTPDPDQGQKTITIEPPPIRQVDNKQMLVEVDASLKAGKTDVAINLLREGIDAEPLDVERRRHLVKVLMSVGQYAVAAQEARRAASLLGEGIVLRTLAVRAWLNLGQTAEAQADLNEALAREPENAEVQLLQGILKLSAGDLPAAVASLSTSIAKAPTEEALFARSVVYALGGDGERSKADLEQANQLGGSEVVRFRLLWPASIGRGEGAGAEIRQLLQQIRVNRKDEAALASAGNLLKGLDSLIGLLIDSQPPAANKNSYDRLVLALNLLSQSVSGVLDYAKTGAEETLSEATINLGEGVKNLNSAVELRRVEN